jgi:hypothetical protein
MKIYHYHPETKEYICDGLADPNPLKPGEWLIPAFATTIQPPVTNENEIAKFIDETWIVEYKAETNPNNPDPPEELTLEQTKAIRTAELNSLCQATICSGFYSSALGESRKYESKIEDQINLMGAVQMNMDMLYRCWNPAGTRQEWYQHTAAQLKQVFMDGSIMVRANLERVSTLKEQVQAATTIEEVEAINW